jgi:hypothetical protein
LNPTALDRSRKIFSSRISIAAISALVYPELSLPCRLLKDLLRGVILSEAKDLLFARIEREADPSIAQNRRDLRMTPAEFFLSQS